MSLTLKSYKLLALQHYGNHMTNNIKKNFYSLFLTLTLLIPAFAESSDNDFDPEFAFEILASRSYSTPPTNNCPHWRITSLIEFTQGLEGRFSENWEDDTQVKIDNNRLLPLGPVNINSGYHLYEKKYVKRGLDGEVRWVPNFAFELVQQDKHTFASVLYLKKNYAFDNNPKIISITENLEVDAGWVFSDVTYTYIIELDNGKILKTQPKKNPWLSESILSWKTGERVIMVGNSNNVCLINVDRSLKSENLQIGGSYRSGLEQVY